MKRKEKTEYKPLIKIVAGHRGTTENIDKDDSSIYLTGTTLNNGKIEDKKIQIKSNSIFIKGSDIRLGTAVENDLQPVVKGDDLLELFEDLISALESATFIGVAPGSPTTPAVNVAQFTNLRTKLKNILSTKVKTQ